MTTVTAASATEEQIHRAIVSRLELFGVEGLVWCHPANGGARSPAEAGRFRAMGVVAGVPDLLLWHRCQAYALEIKAERGRLSPAQAQMLQRLTDAGVVTAVVYGLDPGLATLLNWGLVHRV